MDLQRKQTDLVTGKTFTTSLSTGSYSQSHIVPYTPQRPSSADSSIEKKKQVTRSKSLGWDISEPELKRRGRVASYKVYTVEGRIKSSLRSGVRWFKDKFQDIRYRW
ncbi:hypothetical protein KP509_36G046200 [Ceratopteris richardii]|uniref:Uncharacterized protein n=1 Tax=Ceratopteris richardii TaxID=49495 RepID=A0A8T2QCQ7_CERRI|nr:hypothetical protein KP509_36G046200 [Ceratopteris richardii]